ncbi:hypothetical protein [Roseinatronobacter sp. NSM]|uniref:hypothetical protein n=1 Tax=Roseinatronobacter sp. NSM TaxID=3457785 RepID=UPI0040370235
MPFGIAVETTEGLTNLLDINDGRPNLSHIVKTRESGSIAIPTNLSSSIILVSARIDPVPNGYIQAGINFGLGTSGNTLSWSFLDQNLNPIEDGASIHVTIVLFGVD